jgi:hypothetical protein
MITRVTNRYIGLQRLRQNDEGVAHMNKYVLSGLTLLTASALALAQSGSADTTNTGGPTAKSDGEVRDQQGDRAASETANE